MTDSNGQPRGGEVDFSLAIPIHNEAENIDSLLDEIGEVLGNLPCFEALLVDDASRDDSHTLMEAWKARNHADWLRLLRLEKQTGQSGALLAGIERSRGALVGAMDGDLQNDPRDLLVMLDELAADPSLAGVTGVRANRRDTFLRRVSSRIGNSVRNAITGDRVTDSACGIKVFRREFWLSVPRFRGMHRFMPTLVRYAGGKVLEVPVNHRPRVAGKAKYGVGNRALRGLRDCLAVQWFRTRMLQYRVAEEA